MTPYPPPDVPLSGVTRVDGSRTLCGNMEILEYTHDAIICWEMGGGGIRYFNRAAEELYGHSREAVLGKVTHELLDTQLTGGIGTLEKTLSRFGVWVGELRHTTKDGRYVYVESRLALMSQSNGRWLVLEVNRDISDRKAAEAARLDAARQLSELRADTLESSVANGL